MISTKAVDDYDALVAKHRDEMLRLLTATDLEAKALPRKNTAPIQIASFEC